MHSVAPSKKKHRLQSDSELWLYRVDPIMHTMNTAPHSSHSSHTAPSSAHRTQHSHAAHSVSQQNRRTKKQRTQGQHTGQHIDRTRSTYDIAHHSTPAQSQHTQHTKHTVHRSTHSGTQQPRSIGQHAAHSHRYEHTAHTGKHTVHSTQHTRKDSHRYRCVSTHVIAQKQYTAEHTSHRCISRGRAWHNRTRSTKYTATQNTAHSSEPTQHSHSTQHTATQQHSNTATQHKGR